MKKRTKELPSDLVNILTKTDADFDKISDAPYSSMIISLSTSSTSYKTGGVHYSFIEESGFCIFEECLVEDFSIDEANKSETGS